jgi:hypothetical protein
MPILDHESLTLWVLEIAAEGDGNNAPNRVSG